MQTNSKILRQMSRPLTGRVDPLLRGTKLCDLMSDEVGGDILPLLYQVPATVAPGSMGPVHVIHLPLMICACRRYANTQIHKYTRTKIHKYTMGQWGQYMICAHILKGLQRCRLHYNGGGAFFI